MKRLVMSIMALMLLAMFLPIVSAQNVEVSTYVLNLGKFDVSTGSFTADFYLDMKCDENCSEVNFEFVNGRAASTDTIIDTDQEKFYRIQANLNSPVDLRSFPFDSQKMHIILEDKDSTVDDLVFVAAQEESGIDDAVVFPGWNIKGWKAETNVHEYSVYDESYSQYIFSIDIQKILLNSFIKIFLPVIFMMLIIMCTFILDLDKIVTRLSMVSTGLVAAVMYHISISNQIPPVGYLTFADKFMVLTYFLILLSFALNVMLLELTEQKKGHIAEKVHRITEYSVFIAYPIMYILLFVLFF